MRANEGSHPPHGLIKALAGMPRCRATLLLLACLVPLHAAAATITINNLNAGSGTGFDDPTPVSAVTGNPATTLGGQRLAAFQAAADDWGATLVSSVTIVIDATMVSLECTQISGVLGSAGPTGGIFRDFPEAPVPGTWFVQALHNALSGSDGSPDVADVFAQFNVDVGEEGCLDVTSWSYVIGAPTPPGTIAFTATVLHEIAHGLGFVTFVNTQTGALALGFSDAYARWLLDETPIPTAWPSLNNAGRKDSATDTGNLTWNGGEVGNVAAFLTAGRHTTSGRVRMYAPGTLSPGSSVSHFDTVLSPNEVMEPSHVSNSQRRLTNHLMLDLGWRAMLQLAVANTDGRSSIAAGSPTTYLMTITNNGPADVSVAGATVSDPLPTALSGATWTCASAGGASCAAANGAGNINTTVTVPRNGVITFTLNATVSAGFSGILSNTLSVGLPANFLNTVASMATDHTAVGPVDLIFEDGFE
jgi:uncharacterized repeat protein (TIGR01451 family)